MLANEILRIIVAMIVGLLVGWERHKAAKPVGQRTMALVAIGACLAAVVATKNFGDQAARMLAGVITGIGFLGAGSIISTGKDVSGLTTATSIWAVAIIGLTIGVGEILLGVIAALFILIILQIPRFNKHYNT